MQYFVRGNILQLPELITHQTLCYIHAGLTGPPNVQQLWTLYNNQRDESRTSEMHLTYTSTNKSWIHGLAPITQAKIWNEATREGLDWRVTTITFKAHSKFKQLQKYINSLQDEGIYININTQSENHNSNSKDTVNYAALAAYKDD